MATRPHLRLWLRTAFFALFVLAPPLDIFRLDLTLGHFILFGHPWTLGLTGFQAGTIGSLEAAANLVSRAFLPIVAVVLAFGLVAWRYGRLYCGWLCPHFSAVEIINALMRRALGRPTLWERSRTSSDRRYLPLLGLGVIGFAFLWALTLLTYLLPPGEVYGNLARLEPTRNQAIFLAAATLVFSLEFLFARHLFCRFGCAVGVFQSFPWMANRRALVVAFDRGRAAECAHCIDTCDDACPMRLKPRTIKRMKFACTQCTQCLSACQATHRSTPAGPLLTWVAGEAARQGEAGSARPVTTAGRRSPAHSTR